MRNNKTPSLFEHFDHAREAAEYSIQYAGVLAEGRKRFARTGEVKGPLGLGSQRLISEGRDSFTAKVTQLVSDGVSFIAVPTAGRIEMKL